MIKIAAIQMCSSHFVNENLKIASQLIREAAKNHAKLVVLPEMFAIMNLNPDEKLNANKKGKIQNFLSEESKKNNLWIAGGTIPIECENNKIRAACLVFDDRGNVVARYDKIHLFDVQLSAKEKYQESDSTQPGDKLVVVDTPFGKLGLAVCYDIRFPELFRCLFNMGAQIFVVPSAFTIPTGDAHWELLARSRAVENFSYFIGACQGGTHSNGRKTFGHSLIIDPWGKVMAKKESIDPGIIYADIDLKKLDEIRHSIPIEQHQRIFFDTKNLIL